jgi:hypothetical protein
MVRTLSKVKTQKAIDPLEKQEYQAVKRALILAQRGEESKEVCYFCQEPITVKSGGAPLGGNPTSFHLSCPCGKSNSVFRGI